MKSNSSKHEQIRKRINKEVDIILTYKFTIRQISKILNVSKSCVHKDLSTRLWYIDPLKAEEVKAILDYHYNIKHINGGEATRRKYLLLNRK